MDIISFNEAATANSRIEIYNANPDSTSGIVTVPKVIASGETVTIPPGRVAVLPNVQIDGVLNVEGEVFIPSGSTLSSVVEKVTSTDNAIVRFDGTTGAVQNSSVIIDDSGNVCIGMPSTSYKLDVFGVVNIGTTSSSSFNVDLGKIGTGTYRAAYLAGNGTDFTILNQQNGALILGTNNGERLRINSAGNVLAVSPTGGLGYGAGSGGTVTQLTSKSTSVTLNKPSGQITMNGAALAAGATVAFTFINNLMSATDIVNVVSDNGNYIVWGTKGSGGSTIWVKNNHTVSLSDTVVLNFNVLKGANS